MKEFTYEKRTNIRQFESFEKAAPYLDTLVSIVADFEIKVDYMKDSPITIIHKFLYPVEKD